MSIKELDTHTTLNTSVEDVLKWIGEGIEKGLIDKEAIEEDASYKYENLALMEHLSKLEIIEVFLDSTSNLPKTWGQGEVVCKEISND